MDSSTGTADSTSSESTHESRLRLFTVAGAALVLVSGLIHLGLAPEYFEEATYLGVLFVGYFAAAAVAAVGVYRDRRWAWWLGAAIAVVAIVGYVAYGTVGLPMAGSEELLEPSGVLAKSVEVLYLGVAGVWLAD